mgnify:CR=1 FL=1
MSSTIATRLIEAVVRDQAVWAEARTAAVEQRLQRVLDALAAERVGTQHFASLTGYGHGDQGRDVVDRVFARVLGAEAAAVRLPSAPTRWAMSDAKRPRHDRRRRWSTVPRGRSAR